MNCLRIVVSAIVVFGFAFCAPALADPTQLVTEQGSPNVFSFKDVPFKEDGTLAIDIENRVAAERTERRERFDTEPGAREREYSETKFTSLTRSDAAELLQTTFGEQIAALTANYADELSDAEGEIHYTSDYSATIDPKGPKDRAMVVSTAPLKDTHGAVPDFDLRLTNDSITPARPLTELTIPTEISDGVALTDVEVAITPEVGERNTPNASLVPAQLGSESNDLAFYPNVMPDTDMAVAAKIYSRCWRPLTAVAICLVGLSVIVNEVLDTGFVGFVLATVVTIVTTSWIQGASAIVVSRTQLTGSSVPSAWRITTALIPQSLGLALLGGGLAIMVCIGLIALIIPGLIILVLVSVAVPVFLIEEPGVSASLSRSSELTRGHRGTVFLLVLIGIFGVVLEGVVRELLGRLGDAPAIAATVVTSSLWGSLMGVAFATLYFILAGSGADGSDADARERN